MLIAEKAEERLCDLRLLQTGVDLRLAILASTSEPTYFPPLNEPNPSLIASGYATIERLYRGGFVMDNPVQDLKRKIPEAWTITTLHPAYPRI